MGAVPENSSGDAVAVVEGCRMLWVQYPANTYVALWRSQQCGYVVLVAVDC